MKNCNYCKKPIKPYQLSRSGQSSAGAIYTPNNSNLGFVSTSGRIYTSHMGCYKTVNKKILPWVILALIFVVIASILMSVGMIDLFTSKSYDWEDLNNHVIIDEAKKTKGIIELVFCGIFFVLCFVSGFGGYAYALSFVKNGEHANDYIDEEAKMIYDAALKKAKKELK
ncbi:unknown transmembrane protein [Mesoplasma florum L1]|uniref:Uncharacterized protein n=1 Tax=Mesoplasma florum (strain ATCC 33453 / NBRC 100688 / NCTC 11704 / L1) TaxID=265311 RepID=Q6F0P0_MESFL|nr:hypothetical protein [Mesoplasma florum]AAT75933.1 unknown transmembrane protein [Mesoplasma florum L1]ATI73539.1 hypothetical protein CQZ69_03180 [Mesoplasma florum]ATI74229.1 hypothetical protein CQZ70_03210 [Mesoplasma florum]AVN61932.1 hypothetical protein CG004_03165 [Mesoplasma florum]